MAATHFLVIGAGSWGTALALLLADNGHPVSLWSREATHREAMRKDHSNQKFLPGIIFPKNITIVDDFIAAAPRHDHILIAVPSHGFRAILEQLPAVKSVFWATKGLDQQTGELLSQVADRILGKATPKAVLTGPSFAKEVATKHPTAVILAANDVTYGKQLQQLVHSPYFRTYLSDDLIGAQLGGAVKNVMAIAVGIADGLEYGTNTKSLLITRGLAEMIRLGVHMGAKQETLIGLSGLGDLILTCSDNQSRNRRFGYLVGQGKTTENACKEVKQVVEGIHATELIYRLAHKLKVEMPITEQMYQLLHEGKSAHDVVDALLTRKIGKEFH